MELKVVNKNRNCVFNGPYAGRDLYITMFQDTEREFVVTHNANIKPISYFTGRETELQELRQIIEKKQKSILISGMGGIGKTHICRKLFEEYLIKHVEAVDESFSHMGYIEYNGDMNSSLQSSLKYKQQDNLEQNQEAAWRELEYLASDGKLLLFVDNVNKSIQMDPSLERLKNIPGTIILTSRLSLFGDEFELYRIDFLSMDQCKDIYEKIRFEYSGRKLNPEEVQDLEYVIENLAGRHTITVELLAYLAKTKLWTVQKLKIELESKGFRLEFHKNGELINIQKSYEVLYDLSKLTKAEQNILEAFCIFPYIFLPTTICNQWLLADAGKSEEDDVLIGLYQKGWLQFDINQESYALHPVFAQFIYEKCKPTMKNHVGLIESFQECLHISEDGSVLEAQHYIPFAESIVEKLDTEQDVRQASVIYMLAYLLQYIAEYKKAERMYEKFFKSYKDLFGENNEVILRGYNNLAALYLDQKEYGKAKKIYEKLLNINQNMVEVDYPCIALIYNNLAEVYSGQNEYEKAEELYKKSLYIYESLLGENHLDTALLYSNLARLYENQRKYEKAEELYKKSLYIHESALGGNHPKTALVYINLAHMYTVTERYINAEKLYEKSLCTFRNTLGENHPKTAINYMNLAYMYAMQKKYIKAEKSYKKSLSIWKIRQGENCRNVALCYYNIGFIYEMKEELELALEYYFKSYKIFKREHELTHEETQLIYNAMKITYTKLEPKGNFNRWLVAKKERIELSN